MATGIKTIDQSFFRSPSKCVLTKDTYLKEKIEMEKYWENKEIKGEAKETWARLNAEFLEKKGNEGIRL